MRIGVICEGPTDFYAIESFLGHSLSENGINANFIALQPAMDRTQPEGGWGNVLLWLKNNPPQARIQKYFNGGSFGGALSTLPFDCLLIQLDSDILGEESFTQYMKTTHNFSPSIPDNPNDRAHEITEVIAHVGQFNDMSKADRDRHLPAPAVESTEAWCVAAFNSQQSEFECLKGGELTNAFMAVCQRSEGRTPQDNYTQIDKSQSRRKTFCEKHKSGSSRIIKSCQQFEAIFNKLTTVYNNKN
jgi:hypothetical protein